jgi:hypothetical protein
VKKKLFEKEGEKRKKERLKAEKSEGRRCEG